MSMPALSVVRARAAWLGLAADYVELTKPKIAVLVLVTVCVAAFVAVGGTPAPLLLVHTLVGTALVAASASALNHFLEQSSDALMTRTADRPLPAGRLSSMQVLLFGGATIVAGAVYLTALTNVRTALLGVATWVSYVWVYTPLKSRTTANTWVGAVAGAMPVLMGWSAMGQPLDVRAFSLFLIVFLWQFPHFMAIAWIYRSEYSAAGLKMLTVVDPSGRRAGALAVVAALALLPVSLLPSVLSRPDMLYSFWALALGVGQLAAAFGFLFVRDERAARRLLATSLLYLPSLMLLLTLGALA